MGNTLYGSKEIELDETTKNQIKSMVYIMENLDDAGRVLMLHTGEALKAKNKLDKITSERK